MKWLRRPGKACLVESALKTMTALVALVGALAGDIEALDTHAFEGIVDSLFPLALTLRREPIDGEVENIAVHADRGDTSPDMVGMAAGERTTRGYKASEPVFHSAEVQQVAAADVGCVDSCS